MRKIIFVLAFVMAICGEARADGFEDRLHEGMTVPKLKNYDSSEHIQLDRYYQKFNAEQCEKYGIDVALSYALIYAESHFKADAYHKNKNGTVDRGLYQFNSCNWKRAKKELDLDCSISELTGPYLNILCGTWELGYCVSRYGNTEKAIAYYNTGNPKVNSNAHSRRVMRYYEWFREEMER